jgi:hypothetical protein
MKQVIYLQKEEREFDAESRTTDHTPIDELIEWLNSMKLKGATHIDWYASSYDGESSEVTMSPFYYYEETEAEIIAREEEEKKKMEKDKEDKDRYERMQYERLKKKFESQ